ncbi:MAG: transcriptional regulator [Bacteroidota bacterium]
MAHHQLDPIIHAPLRLAIISFLVSEGQSDFNELKEVTESTSGNLSVQLKKMQKAGYIDIKKGFKNNYQHTSVEITPTGLDAFEHYVTTINQFLK